MRVGVNVPVAHKVVTKAEVIGRAFRRGFFGSTWRNSPKALILAAPEWRKTQEFSLAAKT